MPSEDIPTDAPAAPAPTAPVAVVPPTAPEPLVFDIDGERRTFSDGNAAYQFFQERESRLRAELDDARPVMELIGEDEEARKYIVDRWMKRGQPQEEPAAYGPDPLDAIPDLTAEAKAALRAVLNAGSDRMARLEGELNDLRPSVEQMAYQRELDRIAEGYIAMADEVRDANKDLPEDIFRMASQNTIEMNPQPDRAREVLEANIKQFRDIMAVARPAETPKATPNPQDLPNPFPMPTGGSPGLPEVDTGAKTRDEFETRVARIFQQGQA